MVEQKEPNVLLILAADVGWFDVDAYHRGIMGGRTPNIDRIAAAGALLTDHYGQASCTAGRAALLKPEGYLAAQIGKNHLGDRNEFLREAVDRPAHRGDPPAAHGDVQGVPAAPGAAGLQRRGGSRSGVEDRGGRYG